MKRHVFFVVALFLIFLLPLLILFLYSLSSVWRYPSVLPESLNLRALRFVADNASAISRSLISSLTYSLFTVACTFLITVLPASVFARKSFRLKRMLEAFLLAPALVPSITFTMGVHYVFILTGLADTTLGIVLVLSIFSYPYMLRALTAGFMAYGEEYDICARNLGASLWRRLARVDLPLLLPSIVSGGTVVFLISFSEYFLVFLIGGGSVPSFTGYLFPFLNSSDRPIASILSLIFLMVPILLFLVIDLTVGRVYKKRAML